MNITEIIPNVIYDNGLYKFKNVFYKYVLRTPIEDKFLQVYKIVDGETLEDISNSLYDDPIYFWTIIIVNNLSDPIFDLPLPEDSIQEIARDLATIDGELNMTKYLEEYDRLTIENDEKRFISVIKREYLNKFLTEMIRNTEDLQE